MNGKQLRLPTAPYVPGSETSIEAAHSIVPSLQRLERRVLGVIEERGDLGATDDEIEVITGLAHQTASARRRALVLRGLVADSGLRRPTRSGRRATVWLRAAVQ